MDTHHPFARLTPASSRPTDALRSPSRPLSAFTPSLLWRWLALFALIANATFNFLAERIATGVPSIAEVSARYPALFTPAPYAFAIWGLLYLATIGYVVFTLRRSQWSVEWHDTACALLIVYSSLGVAWAEVFRHLHLGLSVAVILAMFALGAWLFGLAKKAVWSGAAHPLCSVPFALYFGWITVATLANANAWAVSRLAFQSPAEATTWTIISISAAVLAAALIAIRYRDSVFPVVIAWALVAIWFAQRDLAPAVATTALIGAALCIALAIGDAVWVWKHPLISHLRTTPHPPSDYLPSAT